ncbi:MAG: hypothetical protein OJF51_003204 [Nitrospira sp.]|nr:MAG: hypothetical protein OJF51_003204 [Nitrospira sp.]
MSDILVRIKRAVLAGITLLARRPINRFTLADKVYVFSQTSYLTDSSDPNLHTDTCNKEM